MLNLLIITKNFEHSKNLLNYISENSHQVKVHSIASTLSEGIEILNNGLIDIALININDDINSIIIALHEISHSRFEKYKKSFLLLANNICYSLTNHYIYECMSSTEDIPTIFLKINELANNKILQLNNSILFSKINRELEYIGYNLSYNGTKYLSECIALIYNNSDCSENLNKNIYPLIAKKYHKTVHNIKCNITAATNCMFYDCDEIRLKNYFNFYTISRPKPKLVIYTILNKLHNNL